MAQSWLVLQLTGSGALLGLVAAAQFLPVLLWLVFVLAGALGTVNSVDQPGRQTSFLRWWAGTGCRTRSA